VRPGSRAVGRPEEFGISRPRQGRFKGADYCFHGRHQRRESELIAQGLRTRRQVKRLPSYVIGKHHRVAGRATPWTRASSAAATRGVNSAGAADPDHRGTIVRMAYDNDEGKLFSL